MKIFFTFLVFLVVTVNAAAQYNGYLNVGDPDVVNYITNNTNYYVFPTNTSGLGEKGVVEKGRLNVSGYVLYYVNYSNKYDWWIDQVETNIERTHGNPLNNWVGNDIFKGPQHFFGTSTKYCAYNNKSNNEYITFYITNCTQIDVFLYHNTTNEGVFSITATLVEDPNNELSISENLNGTSTFSPSLSGLDKTKIYKIKLTIPSYTCLYEVSFLINSFETTIGNSNWATMYLDYPVRIPKTEHPELIVYTILSADDDNRVVTDDLSFESDYIPANTGVLLYEETATHETITFTETGKDIDAISSNWLTGTTTALNKDDNYGLEKGNYALTLGYNQGNLGFFVYKGETIGANKAFIVTDFAQSVKGFYLGDFGEFTGIQTVENESTETGNWYSLQGVRLNARPTQRGIYLNNGKKVLVK